LFDNVYKKRDFKACDVRQTAAYLGVCEDLKNELNAEITLLYTLFLVAEVIQQVATLGGGNCKAVATLIFDIVGVTLNPYEAYLVAAEYA
jgi:hypothetical protein